jgi:predicted permease
MIVGEPWFSTAAVVTLALGIGVNALGFTVVKSALLDGPPFEGLDRLYVLRWQESSGRHRRVSHAGLRDWRDQSRTFDQFAAFRSGTVTVGDDHEHAERLRASWVTPNAFDVLRQNPLLGRAFARDEGRSGAAAVVILSHDVWRSRYGADRDVLGATLRVNGRPATVVGIMPEGMRFPDDTEIWAPYVPVAVEERQDARQLVVFGRLATGVTRSEAQAEMDAIGAHLVAAYPDAHENLARIHLETFAEYDVGGVGRTMLVLLMGGVCFVLLIACANVANLLLARSVPRAREMALRMTLGATRWRVLRLLLVESAVLGILAGGIGLYLADAGAVVFDAWVGNEAAYWVVTEVDPGVFGYVAAVCLLAAFLSSLAPALHVTRDSPHDLLREGGLGAAGSRRARWLSGTLVVGQIALSVVLLVGAGLMARSLLKLYSMDLGIRTDGLLALRLELSSEDYPTPEARRAFYEQLEPRLGAIPGVEAAALTTRSLTA